MIKNDRPYTNECGHNDFNLVTDHNRSEQERIFTWIKKNISKRKTPLYGHSSYTLKHLLEKATGIYLSNNEFKDAMLLCGFKPIDENDLNWNYCISKRSKAFIQQKVNGIY